METSKVGQLVDQQVVWMVVWKAVKRVGVMDSTMVGKSVVMLVDEKE